MLETPNLKLAKWQPTDDLEAYHTALNGSMDKLDGLATKRYTWVVPSVVGSAYGAPYASECVALKQGDEVRMNAFIKLKQGIQVGTQLGTLPVDLRPTYEAVISGMARTPTGKVMVDVRVTTTGVITTQDDVTNANWLLIDSSYLIK